MKNIWVTGAGKGIGFQCVKSLSFSNNKIFALIRSRKDLKKFKNLKNVKVFIGSVNSTRTINKIFKFTLKKKLLSTA